MPPSSTSRVPVELWQNILQSIILELDILNPDPYDVPPSKLFARAVYMRSQDELVPTMSDDRYRNFISQITKLRLVCTGWDSFARPFLDCVISLSYDPNDTVDRYVESEVASRAIKMIRTPVPPRCPCRFGERCSQCGLVRPAGGAHMLIDDPTSIRMAESIDSVNNTTLTTLLDSAAPFPNLRGLGFFWSGRLSQELLSSVFRGISIQMPNLVHLEIDIWWMTPDPPALEFPHLKSLAVYCLNSSGLLLIQKWKLTSLKSFLSRDPAFLAEQTITILKDNAPNLTFLSFLNLTRSAPNKMSNIWAIFPNPPPPTHPLRHFMIGKNPFGSIESLASNLLITVKSWANCQTVFAEGFQWIDAYRAVYEFNRAELEREFTLELTSTAATAYLRLGLELEELGVRFEDTHGLSFAEAYDRFSPIDTREALRVYEDLGALVWPNPEDCPCLGGWASLALHGHSSLKEAQ